jgi:hypothetical protein
MSVQQCSADTPSTQRYELRHQRHRELRKGLSTNLLPMVGPLSLLSLSTEAIGHTGLFPQTHL